jgi:predicted RNA-binding Zn-ribbon protein involved in translation (DUF1610 family)
MAKRTTRTVIDIKTDPVYAAVICPNCGQVKIPYSEYMKQLQAADSVWKCPNCMSPSEFDQYYYERHNYPRSGSWKNQSQRRKGETVS